MLRAAGVDPDAPALDDVVTTWEVYRRFAAEPVDGIAPDAEADGVLAQFGTFDWGAGPAFELDMTRQLAFEDEDGEYDHMAQVTCTFRFPANDALTALSESNLWSFDLTLDEFFARALALPGFAKVATAGVEPTELEIAFGEV